MKLFQEREVREAMDFAEAGEVALHVHSLTAGHPLFARYPEAGHLIDRDIERLKKLAVELGVRVIKVERVGVRGQHVDLCGRPFERAKALCGGETQAEQLALF
jgi:hypothetical protein